MPSKNICRYFCPLRIFGLNELSVLAFLFPFGDKSQRREEVLSSSPKYLHTRNPRRIVSEAREVENPKGEPCHSWVGKPETIGGRGKSALAPSAFTSKLSMSMSEVFFGLFYIFA